MKRYKSSDLTQRRSEVIKEAKENGVIIECRNTNGEVEQELFLISNKHLEMVKIEDKDGYIHRSQRFVPVNIVSKM